jgi:hypothetical protein
MQKKIRASRDSVIVGGGGAFGFNQLSKGL